MSDPGMLSHIILSRTVPSRHCEIASAPLLRFGRYQERTWQTWLGGLLEALYKALTNVSECSGTGLHIAWIDARHALD
jgi:hypothetical protein